MYIVYVICLFSVLRRGVGALHISIIITVIIAELVLRYHSSNLRRCVLDKEVNSIPFPTTAQRALAKEEVIATSSSV